MSRSTVPFNIDLLDLTPAKLQYLREVKVLDIFDGGGSNSNFHDDGLFSVATFGRVGDEARFVKFGYINIKVTIFHPVIYRALVSLKELYAGIIAGNEYAIWDKGIKDFVRSDAVSGQTGFSFFLEHWKDIIFEQTKSVGREQAIELVNKYKGTRKAVTDKIIVMPAGIRDVEFVNGRVRQDEINTYYAKILGIANTISEAAATHNPDLVDNSRWALQREFNALYDTIENMIQGKKKLFMGKWASRRIFNGTRNVLTAMKPNIEELGAKGNVQFNDTIIGLYQLMKAILPVTQYYLKTGFLSKVFSSPNARVKLVNKRTLRMEEVELKPAHFDRWMTDEGLEKITTAFAEESIRHQPLEIEGRYLGLIYKGPDGTFKVFQDIEDIPEHMGEDARKYVTPLTFAELVYTSIYKVANNYPLFITRYPVTGMGSIYPSRAYLRTTVKAEKREELDNDWLAGNQEEFTARQFPIAGENFVNSMSPHSAFLGGLGADFDGDTGSATAVYSDEAIAAVNNYFKSRQAYIGTNGKFSASVNTDTAVLVLYNLTG